MGWVLFWRTVEAVKRGEAMSVEFHLDELSLMAYMRERAKGYDDKSSIDSAMVAKDLDWNRDRIQKAQTYLASWSLIAKGRVRTDHWVSYYLTADGENFMRKVEREPQVQEKLGGTQVLTWSALKALGGTAKDVCVRIAAAILSKLLMPGS